MDDTNNPAALDQATRDALNEEDRAFGDDSDGIDWDEITATTQPDWEVGRFSFDSADYPTQEAAEAALWDLICSIERDVHEPAAATAADAPRNREWRGQVDGRTFPRNMPIVETFINRSITMATVNFSVPDEVKAEFDQVFGDQNKSAIIAELMRTAVAEAKRRKQRESIFRTLTQRRAARPSRTDKQIRTSRTAGRS